MSETNTPAAEEVPWPEPPRTDTFPGTRFSTVHGDTEGSLTGDAQGGDQRIVPDAALNAPDGPGGLVFAAYGDADTIEDMAAGGADTLTAVAGRLALSGDARFIWDEATGGDDVLRGNAPRAVLVGDAAALWGSASGGDDTVAAGGGIGARPNSFNELYGDAGALAGAAQGGDDRLEGGGSYPGSENLLYGDGFALLDLAAGGNDTLVGGQNALNEMWGDAAVVAAGAGRGSDVFVIGPFGGVNIIHDFQPGRDVIDLSGFAARGIRSLDDLLGLAEFGPEGMRVVFSISGDPDIAPGLLENSLKVFGYGAPRAEDFVFGA